VVDDLAFLFQFFDVGVQAHFADRADGCAAYFERDPFARFRHEELLRLQVRVETALRLAVGVRYVVARYRLFPRQITNFRHDSFDLCGVCGAAKPWANFKLKQSFCLKIKHLQCVVTPRGLEPLTF
jgi:hypothetical protein